MIGRAVTVVRLADAARAHECLAVISLHLEGERTGPGGCGEHVAALTPGCVNRGRVLLLSSRRPDLQGKGDAARSAHDEPSVAERHVRARCHPPSRLKQCGAGSRVDGPYSIGDANMKHVVGRPGPPIRPLELDDMA